jgi:hypothetical protein
MNYQPDIVLRDNYGAPLAWVEVVATEYKYDDFDTHGFYQYVKPLGVPRFFLLITLAEVNLWDKTALRGFRGTGEEEEPSLTGRLPRYLSEQVVRRRMHKSLMAEAVFEWLVHLREFWPEQEDSTERKLDKIGFVKALRNARVEFGAAA